MGLVYSALPIATETSYPEWWPANWEWPSSDTGPWPPWDPPGLFQLSLTSPFEGPEGSDISVSATLTAGSIAYAEATNGGVVLVRSSDGTIKGITVTWGGGFDLTGSTTFTLTEAVGNSQSFTGIFGPIGFDGLNGGAGTAWAETSTGVIAAPLNCTWWNPGETPWVIYCTYTSGSISVPFTLRQATALHIACRFDNSGGEWLPGSSGGPLDLYAAGVAPLVTGTVSYQEPIAGDTVYHWFSTQPPCTSAYMYTASSRATTTNTANTFRPVGPVDFMPVGVFDKDTNPYPTVTRSNRISITGYGHL